MRRLIRGILLLAAVIAALAAAYYILLAPTRNYTINNAAQGAPDIRGKILKSMPKNFSLANKSIKVAFSLTEEEISSLIMSQLNAGTGIEGIDTDIDGNKMEIYLYKKVQNLIPVEGSVVLSSKVEGDKIKLTLEKSRLGRFELDKTKILNELKNSNIPFFDVRPQEGEIILEDKELSPAVKLTSLTLEDNTVSVEAEIKINSMEDLKKIMNLLGR